TFPEWCKECIFLDLPLFLLLGNEGRVKYINEVMSVYRKNAGSQVFNKNYETINSGLAKMHELTNKHFNYKLNKNLTIKMAEEYYSIAIKKFNEGNVTKAGYYLRKSITKQLSIGKRPEKYKIYLGIQIYAPFLLKLRPKK
ncbi:MAG: hypothetical protein JWQ14_280, partial [Adhaeribacter sp.]|nr:hypothetical protein [Adhaeribacter sp.]